MNTPRLLMTQLARGLTLMLVFSSLQGPPSAAAAEAATTAPDTAATAFSCNSLDRHRLAVGELINNQWNRASAGEGPWRQCLQRRVRGGATEYGWSWQWPAKAGLYAYPEVLVGRSPWMATPTNDPRFPRTVADTKALRIDYDVEMTGSGRRNLAVEFWFTQTALAAGQPDVRSIRAELMIWSEASPGMVSREDKPAGTVEISGAMWDVYVKRDWGEPNGTKGPRWALISYHAHRPTTATRYDARKFMEDAIQRGVIAATDTIAGVELGNEIVSGSGSTWLRKLDIVVE